MLMFVLAQIVMELMLASPLLRGLVIVMCMRGDSTMKKDMTGEGKCLVGFVSPFSNHGDTCLDACHPIQDLVRSGRM